MIVNQDEIRGQIEISAWLNESGDFIVKQTNPQPIFVRSFRLIYLIVAENVKYLERPAVATRIRSANFAATYAPRVFSCAITANSYIASWVKSLLARASAEYFCTRAMRNSDNDVAVFIRVAIVKTARDATATAFFLTRRVKLHFACLRVSRLLAGDFHSMCIRAETRTCIES